MAKTGTATKAPKREAKKDERPIIANDEAAKAMKILQAEAKKRAEACAKEVEEVLKKHRCAINQQPYFQPQSSGGFVVMCHWTIAPRQ